MNPKVKKILIILFLIISPFVYMGIMFNDEASFLLHLIFGLLAPFLVILWYWLFTKLE